VLSTLPVCPISSPVAEEDGLAMREIMVPKASACRSLSTVRASAVINQACVAQPDIARHMGAQPLLAEAIVECDQAIAPEPVNRGYQRPKYGSQAEISVVSANVGRHDAAPEGGWRLRLGMSPIGLADKSDFTFNA
jgi:hypothetical protein